MQISRTFLKKKNRSTAPSRRRNVSELPCRNCWPRQRVRARGKKKKTVQKNPISTGFFPERREILEVGFVSDMEEFSFSNSFFQQSSLMANAIVPKKKWGTWWGKKWETWIKW